MTVRLLYWRHQVERNEPPECIDYEDRWDYYSWFDSEPRISTHEVWAMLARVQESLNG